MSDAVDENGYLSLGRVVSALTAISLVIGIGTQCTWKDVGATPVADHRALEAEVDTVKSQLEVFDTKLDRNFCADITSTTQEFEKCMERRGH